MTASPQSEQHDRIQREIGDQLETLIGEQVLHLLGQPGDLLRVQVRKLWPGRYRVNVLVGADMASARVAHSFFLATDGGGNIANAVPQIVQQYRIEPPLEQQGMSGP